MSAKDCIGQNIKPGDYVTYCYVHNYSPTNRIGRVSAMPTPKTEYHQQTVTIQSVALPTYKKPEMHLVRTSVTQLDRLVVIPEHLVPAEQKLLLEGIQIKG